MARYSYVGISQSGRDVRHIAQDEIYINGRSISEQIEGYTQLSVTGRDSKPYIVETIDSVRRSGARPVSYRTEPFDMTIRYLIRAETSFDLREKVDQLGDILRQGNLQVEFEDDLGYFYKDVFYTGQEDTEETTNNKVSSFTLTFYAPYKYEREQTTGEVVSIDAEFVEVDEIRVDFEETIERPTIRINNGIYRTEFRLVGEYNTGDVFRLVVGENGQMTYHGGTVELGTLPRELIVYNGATGQVLGSNVSTVEFKWRGYKS